VAKRSIEDISSRRNLAIADTYHACLKMLAASRTITLTQLTEEILYDAIKAQLEEDPQLLELVRQLVGRDEKGHEDLLRERTLDLIDYILTHDQPPGR
jgi:hypothetical protein